MSFLDFAGLQYYHQQIKAYIDSKSGSADGDYLPLAGGTMTGPIQLSGDSNIFVTRDNDSGALFFFGGKDISSGATLSLSGAERSGLAGFFILSAKSADGTISDLYGKPDGTLTWASKNIVRSYNGTTADTAGNVAYTGSLRLNNTNFVPSAGDTTAGWQAAQNNKTEVFWYSSIVLSNQPSQYGHLISSVMGTDVAQIFVSAPSGTIYTRGGNANGWQGNSTTSTWYPGGLPTVGSAATYGETGAGTLSFGGTFTTPYVTRDAYGRVTSGGTRTLTMPAAPTSVSTATKATAISNIAFAYGHYNTGSASSSYGTYNCSRNNTNIVLPSGGTWAYCSSAGYIGTAAGGATIYNAVFNLSVNPDIIFVAIRIS